MFAASCIPVFGKTRATQMDGGRGWGNANRADFRAARNFHLRFQEKSALPRLLGRCDGSGGGIVNHLAANDRLSGRAIMNEMQFPGLPDGFRSGYVDCWAMRPIV